MRPPVVKGQTSPESGFLVFFLGRQNELEEVLFEGCEIGFRVTTKARAMHAPLTTALQLLPQRLPLLEIVRGKFSPLTGRSRVAAHAAIRTIPRTTRAGDAPLRPVVRRSW